MTRINTNVSSLNAQKSLARSNAQLQTALTRLSTGLRINTGKDDPAGLIASEILRSDIVGVKGAINNSQQANQMLATADSALGQVSSLLDDIRGLVEGAANTGAMSSTQIAANQLQIDSSLEAIDRISQTTQFQGRRLLDGSLDFITTNVDTAKLDALQINQANLGATGQMAVTIELAQQATQATLRYEGTALAAAATVQLSGKSGSQAFSFSAGATISQMAAAINLVSDATGVTASVGTGATAGHITVSGSGASNDLTLTANTAGADEGNFRVKFSKGDSSGTTVSYVAASGSDPATIDVQLKTQAWVGANVKQLDDTNLTANGENATYSVLFNPQHGSTDGFTMTAAAVGPEYNIRSFQLVDGTAGGVTAGNEIVNWDSGTGTLTVYIENGVSTVTNVSDAINTEATFATSGVSGGGNLAIISRSWKLTATTASTGTVDNNALDITAKIAGTQFNNTDVNIVAGDATGSEAGTTTNRLMAKNYYYGGKSAGVVNNNFWIQADEGGNYAGANGANLTITFVDASPPGGGVDVDLNLTTHTLTVTADLATATATNVVDAINNDAVASAHLTAGTSAGGHAIVSLLGQTTRTLGDDGTVVHSAKTFTNGGNSVTLTAVTGGPLDGAKINGLSVILTDDDNANVSATLDMSAMTLTIRGDWDNGGAGRPTRNDINTALSTAGTGAADSGTTNVTNGEAGLVITDYLTVSVGGVDADIFTAAAAAALWTSTAPFGGATPTVTVGEGDAQVEQGIGTNGVAVVYNQSAVAAKASVHGIGTHASFILTAPTAGTAYNGVSVVFHDTGVGTAGSEYALYESAAKILHLYAEDTASEIGDVLAAIERDTDFTAAGDSSVSSYVSTTHVDFTSGNAYGNTGSSGADAGTLSIYVEQGVTTAADVINAMTKNWNAQTAELFTIASSQDNDGSGLLFDEAHVNALTGGVTGGAVVATGTEVINAINSTTGLSTLVTAALASGNSGILAASAFEEVAYSGDPNAQTQIQFLGKEGARNIRYVSTAGESLSIDLTTDPEVTANSTATLAAQNDNASMVFRAIAKGSAYDDTIVRFRALAKGAVDPTVTYSAEPSAAEAFVELAATGAAGGGDIRLTANTHGDEYNGVSVYLYADATIMTDAANVSYDAANKKLMVGVKAGTTGMNTVIAAITAEGTFTAAADYRDHNNPTLTTKIQAGDLSSTVAIADTGTTGGHVGGVLEFGVINGQTTADDIVTLLSNDDVANKFFQVSLLGTSGAGLIDVDADTNKAITSGGVTSAGTLIVHLATDANGLVTTTAKQLVDYFHTSAEAATAGITASLTQASGTGSGILAATTSDIQFTTTGVTPTDAQASGEVAAVHGINARYTVTAVNSGATYNGVTLEYINDQAATGTETAEYEVATKTIKVHVKLAGVGSTSTANQVITAINRDLATLFSATASGSGAGEVAAQDTLLLSGGVVDVGTIAGAAFLDNSDAAATGLTLTAQDYGSSGFVAVNAIVGSFTVVDSTGATSTRATGTDIIARVNGIQAVGDGLSGSVTTAALQMAFTVESTMTAGQSTTFNITGGGALFQLGPEVVTNQQSRLGIASVNAATLGGTAGRLYELRSGGSKSLTGDIIGAGKVVNQVISQVATLRGRIGAFQKTTVDTNINSLTDTLENLTAAESTIRDADFAEESANLTRAQILSQSGLSVLAIANSRPQQVLSLLRQ